MSLKENLTISGSIFVGLFGLILLILIVVITTAKGEFKIKVTNNFSTYAWVMIILFILVVIGGVMLSFSVGDSFIMGAPKEPISGEDVTVTVPIIGNQENFGSDNTYVNIGFGPLVDKTRVSNWINGKLPGSSLPGTSNWIDNNGDVISLPTPAFKSIYGFIPPSFSYFPQGQDTNLYNPENYETGREKCMEVCSLTNCRAVQTEVPQNCFHETIITSTPTGEDDEGNPFPKQGEFENGCANQSSHSCTLFYDNIENADDAYWTINQLGNGGCVNKEGEELLGCLGKKFYEDATIPAVQPTETQVPIKPSESTVKWCDFSVSNSNPFSAYAGNNCTCTTEEDCDDPACCRFRNLLTTESLNSSHPYFNLPIDISSLETNSTPKLVKAVNIAQDGSTSCCGLCPPSGFAEERAEETGKDKKFFNNSNDIDDSEKILISCKPNKCENSSQKDCWTIDKFAPETFCSSNLTQQQQEEQCTKTSSGLYCDGDNFENRDEPSGFFQKFKEMFDPDRPKYNQLMRNCFFRNQASVPSVIQFNCPADQVVRGCFGSPPVLITEDISGEVGACSNDSIIPQVARCEADKKGVCTGFPYQCGSQFGSNRLWIKK